MRAICPPSYVATMRNATHLLVCGYHVKRMKGYLCGYHVNIHEHAKLAFSRRLRFAVLLLTLTPNSDFGIRIRIRIL